MNLPYQSAAVDREDFVGAAVDQNVDPAFLGALAPIAGMALKAAAPSLIQGAGKLIGRFF
ncbi:MAG: hypothetical protein ABJH45_08700 [Paracoccaceae bacterium]